MAAQAESPGVIMPMTVYVQAQGVHLARVRSRGVNGAGLRGPHPSRSRKRLLKLAIAELTMQAGRVPGLAATLR